MPGGGKLVIETSNKILDKQYVQMNPGSSTGEFILISVSDTGCGMVKDMLEQIFQPFFTTKEAGKGTGLGLSMVYGFVQRSGGHIKAYSEPEKGTTFNIYLPRVVEDTDVISQIPAGTLEELPRGDETILIVDDEEGLIKVAVGYLEDLGYKTQIANNGKQALDMLKENIDIDIIFSDVVMPGGIDGYDLGKEVLKNHPDIKVLLTSGFTSKREEAVNGDIPLIEELSRNLLNKPYNQQELIMAIRKALDKKEKA